MKGKERGFLRFELRSLVHKRQHYGVVGYGMGQVEHQRCSETITIDRGRGVSLSFSWCQEVCQALFRARHTTPPSQPFFGWASSSSRLRGTSTRSGSRCSICVCPSLPWWYYSIYYSRAMVKYICTVHMDSTACTASQ